MSTLQREGCLEMALHCRQMMSAGRATHKQGRPGSQPETLTLRRGRLWLINHKRYQTFCTCTSDVTGFSTISITSSEVCARGWGSDTYTILSSTASPYNTVTVGEAIIHYTSSTYTCTYMYRLCNSCRQYFCLLVSNTDIALLPYIYYMPRPTSSSANYIPHHCLCTNSSLYPCQKT